MSFLEIFLKFFNILDFANSVLKLFSFAFANRWLKLSLVKKLIKNDLQLLK